MESGRFRSWEFAVVAQLLAERRRERRRALIKGLASGRGTSPLLVPASWDPRPKKGRDVDALILTVKVCYRAAALDAVDCQPSEHVDIIGEIVAEMREARTLHHLVREVKRCPRDYLFLIIIVLASPIDSSEDDALFLAKVLLAAASQRRMRRKYETRHARYHILRIILCSMGINLKVRIPDEQRLAFEREMCALIPFTPLTPLAVDSDLAQTECAVCWGTNEEEEAGEHGEKCALPCAPGVQHVFHTACLRHWLERGDSCPLCRMQIAGREMRAFTLWKGHAWDIGQISDSLRQRFFGNEEHRALLSERLDMGISIISIIHAYNPGSDDSSASDDSSDSDSSADGGESALTEVD